MPGRLPLDQKFWQFVDIGDGEGDGCWRWIGSKTTVRGYGMIFHRGTQLYAHRVSWFLAYGKMPGKWHVLHRCDNPHCVRPAHLFLGTASDNSQDMWNKGRHPVPKGGHGKSGTNGVVWEKGFNKWKAMIHTPKAIYLGLHASVIEAKLAVSIYRAVEGIN